MIDIIPHTMDIFKYEVVILPFMIIWKEKFVAKIKEFVNNGGKVVFTYRNAIKDIDNNLTLNEMLPVRYTDLTGVYIEETESLQEYDELPLKGIGEFEGVEGRAGIFRDMLVPTTAQTLMKYDDKFYNEFSAVTKNKVGAGEVYYIGCGLEDKLMTKVMEKVLEGTDIVEEITPEGVEVVERGNLENRVKIYINHNDYSVKVKDFELAPFECKVVK